MNEQDTRTEEDGNPYAVSKITLDAEGEISRRAGGRTLHFLFACASGMAAVVAANKANELERHFRGASHPPDLIAIAAPLVALAATVGVYLYGVKTVQKMRTRANTPDETPSPDELEP